MLNRSSQVCQYFLRGHCKYGSSCWNHHQDSTGSGNVFGGQDYNDSAAEQNKFSGFVKQIETEMNMWEKSGIWLLSSLTPLKSHPTLNGFTDTSPEELRLEAYEALKKNDINSYRNGVNSKLNYHSQLREALRNQTPEALQELRAVFFNKNLKTNETVQFSRPSNFTSLFGTLSSSGASLFGGAADGQSSSVSDSSAPSESSNVFGRSGSIGFKPKSVFGGTTAFGSLNTQSNSFGASTSGGTNIFGTPTANTSSFGGSQFEAKDGIQSGSESKIPNVFAFAASSQGTPNIFGSSSSLGTTSTFGSVNPNLGTSNIFGSTSGHGTSNVFGSTSLGPGTSVSFGSPTAAPGSSNSFGSTTLQGTSNIFASNATQGTSSVFGSATSEPGKSNFFGSSNSGQGTSNTFDSAAPGQGILNTFGSTAPGQGTLNTFGSTAPGQGPLNTFGSTAPGQGTLNTFGSTAPGQGILNTFGSTAPGQGTLNTFGSTAPDQGTLNTFGSTAPGQGTLNTFGSAAPGQGTLNTFGSTTPGQGTLNTFGSAAPGQGTLNTFGSAAPGQGTLNTFGSAAPGQGTLNTFGSTAPGQGTLNTFSSAAPGQGTSNIFDGMSEALPVFSGLPATSASAQTQETQGSPNIFSLGDNASSMLSSAHPNQPENASQVNSNEMKLQTVVPDGERDSTSIGGQSQALFGGGNQLQRTNPAQSSVMGTYTPMHLLNAEDRAEFERDTFHRIPIVPPPKELCI